MTAGLSLMDNPAVICYCR